MQQVLADALAAGCNKGRLLSHKRHAIDGAHRLYADVDSSPRPRGFRLYLHEETSYPLT